MIGREDETMSEPVGNESATPTLGSRALYFHNLRWSLRAWGQGPWFVVLTVVLQGAIVALAGKVSILVLPLELFLVGFVGTERIFYLRVYRGNRLNWREVVPITWRFLGRFIVLGLIVVIPFTIVFFVVAIATRPAVHGHFVLSGWSRVTLLAFSLLIDVLLTFVVPALAFSTRSAGEALRLGVQMLKHTWPASAWYAFAPGITVTVVALALPRSLIGYWATIGVAMVGGALGLAFKGAVVPFYLQRTDGVGVSGAASSSAW
jgi:hypothetical protein